MNRIVPSGFASVPDRNFPRLSYKSSPKGLPIHNIALINSRSDDRVILTCTDFILSSGMSVPFLK